MSRLRRTLVALLVASTALFAIGAIAERSSADTHVSNSSATEEEGHSESAPELASESAEAQAEDEDLLGVDLESTPLLVLGVLAGLALAAVAASRIGRLRGFLLAVALVALAWAALDIREVVHQLDESRTGIALVAIAVAILHLAVGIVSARLARPASS